MNEKLYKSFENKQYYDCNRDSILKNKQKYYENHKIEIREKRRARYLRLKNRKRSVNE
tara:strand:- start:309 stop:482 length:174 start_codon:yes stop_codon:yes gene_type:complete